MGEMDFAGIFVFKLDEAAAAAAVAEAFPFFLGKLVEGLRFPIGSFWLSHRLNAILSPRGLALLGVAEPVGRIAKLPGQLQHSPRRKGCGHASRGIGGTCLKG